MWEIMDYLCEPDFEATWEARWIVLGILLVFMAVQWIVISIQDKKDREDDKK